MADFIEVPQSLIEEAGTLAFLASDLDSALFMMKLDRNMDSFYESRTCFEIGSTQEITVSAIFNLHSHLDNKNAEYAEKIDSSVDSD